VPTIRLVTSTPKIGFPAGVEPGGVFSIHHGATDSGPNPKRFASLKNGICVVQASHVHKGRGSPKEKLHCADSCAQESRFRRVRCFEWPNSFAKPREQGPVLGHPAKERLAEVNMRLNKSRKNPFSVGIHNLCAVWLKPRPNFNNFPTSHTQVSSLYSHLIATRQKKATLEKQMHAHRPNKSA